MATLREEAARIPGDREGVFGEHVDATWKLLREYPARAGGRRAKLWVMRLPAHFWRVTVGDVEFSTGSGDEIGDLADRLARAFAEGMIGCSLVDRGEG